MNPQIIWFRNDLRTYDNPALQGALAAGPTLGVYIATPGQWRQHHDADIKLDFWRRNLQLLKRSLAKQKLELIFFQVDTYRQVADLLAGLCQTVKASGLHFNIEYPLNEWQRDQEVIAALESLGLEVKPYHDRMLLEPKRVMTKAGSPFKVFTPFARQARAMLGSHSAVSAVPSPPEQAHAVKVPRSFSGRLKLDAIDWPAPDKVWSAQWPAGEEQAQQRLQEFCRERIALYHKQRDFPDLDATSQLSPYLNSGVLSVRECWRQAQTYAGGEGVDAWLNELLWRDFYSYVVCHFPHVCQGLPWRRDMKNIPWRHDDKDFQAWCEGRTGFPLIDAAMRQLSQRGWMHNRLRMVVAMFLSKHLLLDWRLGERWFMEHLIDGDFAANNGGWQWSASTGTDAAPYFRIFNPLSQSRRFDPQGGFIRQYLPELTALSDQEIHEPGLTRPGTYPLPMLDLRCGRERALKAFRQGGD